MLQEIPIKNVLHQIHNLTQTLQIAKTKEERLQIEKRITFYKNLVRKINKTNKKRGFKYQPINFDFTPNDGV